MTKIGKVWVRGGLAARQNAAAIAFVVAWLGTSFLFFVRGLKMTPKAALFVTVCLNKAASVGVGAYQTFTEVVVFGVVASLVVSNVTRRYRPEQTCRALSERLDRHVVVVGFTHLGRRVWETCRDARVPVSVVEGDATLVHQLIHDEDPVVVGDARERATLEAAAVSRARVVVIATDDLELAAVACRFVRERNESCELVVRCADEDVGAVLARTYRARAVSTSRVAASFVESVAKKVKARRAVVLGESRVAERVAAALAHERLVVSRSSELRDDADDLIVLCDDDLGKNLVAVDRIRDRNKRAKVVCRAFQEEAAAVLERPPFGCQVFSTSRQAVQSLVRAGVFREVGIDQTDTLA